MIAARWPWNALRRLAEVEAPRTVKGGLFPVDAIMTSFPRPQYPLDGDLKTSFVLAACRLPLAASQLPLEHGRNCWVKQACFWHWHVVWNRVSGLGSWSGALVLRGMGFGEMWQPKHGIVAVFPCLPPKLLPTFFRLVPRPVPTRPGTLSGASTADSAEPSGSPRFARTAELSVPLHAALQPSHPHHVGASCTQQVLNH
jgi:hypothetical protein